VTVTFRENSEVSPILVLAAGPLVLVAPVEVTSSPVTSNALGAEAVVRRYDDFTLDIRYGTSRLDEGYRFILEGWLERVPETHSCPRGEVRLRVEGVFLSRVIWARLTGEEFVLPELPSDD
jgi:hypothetical protein